MSADLYLQRDIRQALQSASYAGQARHADWQAALVAVALAFGIEPATVIYLPVPEQKAIEGRE